MKVLIIGAGPSGLAAALQLAKYGIIPRIAEKRTEPSVLSRAVGIMPVTIDKLRPLGAAEAILKEAMPLRRISISRDGNSLIEIDNRHNDYREKCLVGLPQNRTEEILRDALQEQNIIVEYGCAAKEVLTDNESVTVQFSDDTSDKFDWVIAADGINSMTRQQLGIEYPGIDLSEKWSIADVDLSGDFDPEQVCIDIQGPAADLQMMLPIEQNRARLVSSTPDTLSIFRWPIKINNVRRTGTFTISIRQASEYQKGRVLLAGDAAHCHSPLGGKGMNLGIDDAIAAAQGITNQSVDTYTDERHKIGKKVLNTTEFARKIVTSRTGISPVLVRMAGFMVRNFPKMEKLLMERLINL